MTKSTLRLAITFLGICTGALLMFPGLIQAQTTNVIVVDGNPIISTGTTMLIEGNMIMESNSTIDNSGNIALTGNWVNNAGTPGLVNQSPGTVTLFGDSQHIQGLYSTVFYNLSLAGNGLKLIDLDTHVLDSLELSDQKLSTETHTLTVESTNAGIVSNTTGYVRSDVGGTFVRNMTGTGTYLFPVGSNITTKYRPVSIQSTAGAAQTFSVNMIDNDPSNDGYNRNSTDGSMCNINSSYYDIINRISGSTAVNLSLFYDSTVDGSFHKDAHWKTSSEWESTGNYSTTSIGNLTGVTTASWNTFNTPVFALADRYLQPAITPAGHVKLCYGTDTVLTASAGYVSYHWSTGETSQSITVSAAGDYFVTGNLGNGSDCVAISDTVHVNIQNQVIPTITAESPTTFCQGGNVILNAGNYDSYSWSNGATTRTDTVNSSNNYNVTVTLSGCSGSSSNTSVSVTPLPNIPTASSNRTVCDSSNLELSTPSVAGASYLWTGPNNFTSSQQNPVIPIATFGDSGTYSVVITVDNCASAGAGSTDVAIAGHSPKPFISKNGHVLSSSSSVDIQWFVNDSLIPGATSQTYTVTHTGYYQVQFTYPGLCPTVSDSFYMLISGIPTISMDEGVKVQPNPFNSQFMIDISQNVTELNKWSVNITDVLGKEVYASNSLQYTNTIDLGNEASGVYFVTVNSSSERKTFKLVKQQ